MKLPGGVMEEVAAETVTEVGGGDTACDVIAIHAFNRCPLERGTALS